MSSDWAEIQPRFQRIVFRRGAKKVAREIPASFKSVYNWAGKKTRPNLAAQERIKEMVDDHDEE